MTATQPHNFVQRFVTNATRRPRLTLLRSPQTHQITRGFNNIGLLHFHSVLVQRYNWDFHVLLM